VVLREGQKRRAGCRGRGGGRRVAPCNSTVRSEVAVCNVTGPVGYGRPSEQVAKDIRYKQVTIDPDMQLVLARLLPQ